MDNLYDDSGYVTIEMLEARDRRIAELEAEIENLTRQRIWDLKESAGIIDKLEVDNDYLRDLERIKDAAIQYLIRKRVGDTRDVTEAYINLQQAVRMSEDS